MTLSEIVATFPDLFYRPEPCWWRGEAFTERDAAPMSSSFTLSEVPWERDPVRAADLVALYVRDPDDPRWRRFIWTDDIDSHGNRVYVGGVGMYGIETFQVHRKLEPSAWWVRWAA